MTRGNCEWSVWWPDNPMVQTVLIVAPTARQAAVAWGEAAHADGLIKADDEVILRVALTKDRGAFTATVTYRLTMMPLIDVTATIIQPGDGP